MVQHLVSKDSTYPDREQVDNRDDDEEDAYPDGVVDALSYRPVEERHTIVVAESYQVGEGDKLVGGHDSVRKPS